MHGEWLVSSDIITEGNYLKLCSRGHLNRKQKGGNGRKALIQFDTMRSDIKDKVIELAGDPYAKVSTITFTDYIEQDQKAYDFFRNFTLDSGDALPEKTQKEYCANANVCNAIDYIVKSKLAQRKALAGSKINVWERLAEVVSELPKHTYPHSLPANQRRLKDKVKQYLNDGYEVFIHKSFGSKNAERLNDEAKSFVLARWCDRVKRVVNYNQLLREYNTKAQEQDWKMLKSEQTLINFLTDPKIEPLWYGYRYGELKSKEKYTFQFSTSAPSVRDSLWYSDGTKINLYYQDENGNRKTTSVYEVMDAYSEVFLGYHISDNEDYEAGYQAYKMAIKTAGHRPYEVKFDNGSGNKKLHNGGFFDKIARLAIKTAPYNGKSKTIESAFGRFQAQICAKYWYFSGQNITATKVSSRANMEFILANTENLPSYKEVTETYIKARQEWNSEPHFATKKPRIDMYFESFNEKSPEVSPFEMVDFFWIERAQPVTCTAFGISFTEKKIKYDFIVYEQNTRNIDLAWLRKNVDKKFHIKFDPDDMTLIYLYDKTSLGLRFVGAAETKPIIHRAKQEQEEFEASFISDILNKNKALRLQDRDEADANLEKHKMRAQDYGLNEPMLQGIESSKSKKPKKEKTTIAKHQKELSEAVLTEEVNGYDIM